MDLKKRTEQKNVWILQTGFVGDCVLALPLLHETARLFPNAQIHFISTKSGVELCEMAKNAGLMSFANRIYCHELKKRNEHKAFWKIKYFADSITSRFGIPDLVLCVQRSVRTALLARLSNCKIRVGFSTGAASFFYTHLVKRDWENRRSEIEKNLDLLRGQGLEVPLWSPDFAPSLLKSIVEGKSGSPQDLNFYSVGISLGSPWPTKMWAIQNVVDLVKKLCAAGVEVKLLGEAQATQLALDITSQVPSLLIKNLVGKTSLKEWVNEISGLNLLVSGDSAAVHVASDTRVPVVALFGPTVPEFGFAPWRKDSIALGVKDLPCRPCDIHGPKKCPLGHHKCMKDLKADLVLKYLDRYLPELAK